MTAALLVLVGLLAGILAAGLGVGGGIVFVPALVVLLNYPQQLAQGTSLSVILPTAVVGAFVHARRGRVDWKLVLPIGGAGILGAIGGAAVALQLDGLVLQRLFATLLTLLAFRLLWTTRSSSSAALNRRINDPGA